MNMTIDHLNRVARNKQKPLPSDVPVDPSVTGLKVIHDWRWNRLMNQSVEIGGDVDFLIKEVCLQRQRVRELEDNGS